MRPSILAVFGIYIAWSNRFHSQLFEQLQQKADQKEIDKRASELDARLQAQAAKQSQRLAALVRISSSFYHESIDNC